MNKLLLETKRTISVHQLIGSPSNMSNSEVDPGVNEGLKQLSLQKLSSAGNKGKKLNRMYDASSNIVEKATSKIVNLNMADTYLPLDKMTLDYIMDVS